MIKGNKYILLCVVLGIPFKRICSEMKEDREEM
jgi:hypothetical protein